MSPSLSLIAGICCCGLEPTRKIETHVSSAGYDTESVRHRPVGAMPITSPVRATVPPPGPAAGTRGRTYRLLLAQAMKLAEDGRLSPVPKSRRRRRVA